MKINIIYVTNQCNLKCPYCYERNKENKKKVITKKEIQQYIKYMVENEPNQVSSTCIIGGEPTLEFDKMYYIFNEFKKVRQKYGKQIAYNFITNGTLLHKYTDKLYEMTYSSEVFTSFEVSYDGSFQHIRTGKSKIVEKNLELLNKLNIPFGISYTITKNTMDIYLQDIIEILERFFTSKSNLNHKKIRINIDRSGIEQELGYKEGNAKYEAICKDLLKSSLYLYSLYEIPLCDFACASCMRCNKSLFDGRHYTIPQQKELFEPLYTKNKFNHF